MRDGAGIGGRSDQIFWRIVPVGLMTVLVSSVGLMVSLGPRDWEWPLAGTVFAVGVLATLFFGGVVWIPLFVLWNMIAFRRSKETGVTRAACRTSFEMALAICLSLGLLLTLSAGDGKAAVLAIGLPWALATSGLAGGLTFLAFRNADLDELE